MPASKSAVPFTDFDLPAALEPGLANAGFSHCTIIQADALPPLLRGQDVAGQAQTGTGKTAAFLIALLTRLLRTPAPETRQPKQPRALILAPTRELVQQIHKDAQTLAQPTGLTLGVAYGGTDYDKQRRHLAAGVDILIGTPGRLIDFFKQKVFDLKALDAVVLDEADRMFDLGFIRDVRYLFRRMPPPQQRLGMLFSATLSYRVTELAYEHMNNPLLLGAEQGQIAIERITEAVYYPANDEKIPLLLGLLAHHQPDRAIVFANTKLTTETLLGYLKGNAIEAGLLSGDVPQRKRQRMLEHFSQGELAVLVATDVASRGLHIPDVSHVLNYDLPDNAEDYVHRIGRTARAGAAGMAISFACEDTAFSLPEIEQFIGHKLPALAVEPELLVTPQPPAKLERRKPGPASARRRGPRSAGAQPAPAPASETQPTSDADTGAAAAAPNAPKKRPRRSRRRKPAGEEPSQQT